MNKAINLSLIIVFSILVGELIRLYSIKKEVAVLKEKKVIKPIYSFIDNNIGDVDLQTDYTFVKSPLDVPEIKLVKKGKSLSKLDTIVKVPVVEHLIEPKKIAEPVELPEPVVIDTPKFKSKIKVSKE